ncbi:monocarboxylate transporter 12-like [Amphiura filiformis]|uniref:monocarboxylate transporter 12-like n=1 Tax=Amphiura filiformis TaxID=82378 RepID=UPI003B22226C
MARRTSTTPYPIDTGYAWVVLASCCVMRILLDGFWTSLGILFVNWEAYFGSSSSETSLIGSIFMMTLCAMAPVSSVLVSRLSCRSVVVGAGICTFICCFAASFITTFWHLYIIMTLLSLSMGMSYAPAYSCFIPYFDQHAALAYMLSTASTGIGLLAVPPLMEFLITHYSWQGALQINSAIMANICVCGIVLRPSPPKTIPIKSRKDRTEQKNVEFKILAQTDSSVKMSCFNFLHDLCADFDLSLFRNVRFIFQAIIAGFFVGAIATYTIYLVPYAVSIGISDFKASLLMLFYGVFIVVARLSPISWMVDKKVISASTLGGIPFLILGCMVTFTPFVRTFTHLVVVSAGYGIFQGIGFPMSLIVIAESPGDKKKAKGALAWYLIAYGLGCLICIFIAGYLYDLTGSYQYSLILCGIWTIITGAILLCDPFLIRWQSQLEKHHEECSSGKDRYTSLSSGNVEVTQV